MALAAMIFVFTAIEELLESPRILVTSFTREILHYAWHQSWLTDTLGLSWGGEVVRGSNEEIIIIEEARSLQDAIESDVYAQFLDQSKCSNPTFFINLDHLKPDVDRFAGMAEKMKGRIEELWEQNVEKVIAQHIMEICGLQNNDGEEEEDISASSTTEMVGLDDEFHRLRNIVVSHCDSLSLLIQYDMSYFHMNIFYVTGMAGVGKTTLAKRVYNDPMVKANFECRAFVREGRGYWRERVMRSLNAQLNHGHEKMIKEGDSLEDILESIRTTIRDNICLIVLDDLWDYFIILDYIRELCGHMVRRTMILVTSRLEPHYTFRSLKLRFMNEDESWELLRKKVFGEEVCPPPLVEAGKKIAKRCGGLPLLINALAPILLYRAQKDPERWKRVAEKPNSLLEEASLQISEVLLTSYSALDEIHKLYFLYITAFPERCDVLCSTINNLLYAEGFYCFLPHVYSHRKSLVLKALVGNNIVLTDMGRSRNSDEIKSCTLHCAYWYINKRVARNNRFLYIMSSYADGMEEHVKSHQRLAIQTNVLLAIKEVFHYLTSISNVCSVLCTSPYNQYQVHIRFEWKMLRVLDVVTIRFYKFPVEVLKLLLLRRTKRVGVESCVPVEIWDLQELIHLEIMGRNMPEPPNPSVVLPKLTHLLDVGIESCSEGVVENIPKLRKLRVQIELASDAAECLACFFDVKSFQCMVVTPTLFRSPPPLSVPVLNYVKKLSLGGIGYPWKEMSKIAKLPNLRVLKLLSYAFRGEKWEVNEELSFMKLGCLYIEDTDLEQWIVISDEKMKVLWNLKLKNCYKLHEIPKLDHILRIELTDCNPLAEISAKPRYIHGVSIAIRYSWKEKKLKSA